jgi:S-DNA-T family DNA segregation ATPase FtsK/SpoIIIE
MAKKETKDKEPAKKIKSKADDGFALNETKKEDDMSVRNFFTDGRFPKILGLFFILCSAFLGIAFASYLSTWKVDQSNVFQFNWHLLFASKEIEVANRLGRLGAIISHQFFFNGPGIASFAFVLIFFTSGFNLLTRKNVFPVVKILQFSLFGIVWIAAALSFVLAKNPFPFGGAMGDAINFWTNGFVGTMGTALNLIITLLIFLTVIYNLNFNVKMPAVNPFSFNKKDEMDEAQNNFIFDNSLKNEAEAIFDDVKTSQQNIEIIEPEIIPSLSQEPLFKPNSGDVEFELNTIEPPEKAAKKTAEAAIPELEIEEPIAVVEPVALNIVAPIDEPKGETRSTIGITEKYDPTLDLSHYKFPTLDLLQDYGMESTSVTKDELEQNKNQIVTTLRNYGIEIDKIKATIGPTVTLYEIVPAAGVRISKIKNLEDDIALSLSALGIRIIAPIPGKGTIGIEVPNIKKELVSMRSLLSSEKFQNAQMDLPIALGKNIANENIIVDLAKMPHVLVAGATGQGKSVGLNAILVSLLYKKHPSQLKFVMVDPKKVELSIYKIIEKHFLAKMPYEEDPIITDTKKVVATLNSLCIEMDRRYDLLKEATCRNLKEYNQKFIDRRLNPDKGHEFLPFIVVVIDEFADLIMTAGKEVEMPIARIAQLARAVGIHLILATQRPSVNIITGTIKANFPARIAFKVSSKIDSRTILDTGGAEQLIGKGDMLISNGGELIRVQCAFCDTPEIEKITEHISRQQGYPTAHYLPEYEDPNDPTKGDIDLGGERDEFFEEAAKIIVQHQQGSTSLIQRRMKLGYNRAGRIMDQLEAAGIVGPNNGSKARDVKYKTEAELMQVLNTLK